VKTLLVPPAHYIEPDWPAPANVIALTTAREGGVSEGRFGSLNLGDHVGDEPGRVATNRDRLQRLLPATAEIQWLSQVHGIDVCAASRGGSIPTADACWTSQSNLACAVMTADCLPVLLTDRMGTVVASAHAGWRGLQAGVLEQAVAAMPVNSGELLAWLGPAIGPAAFEVGVEVRQAFIEAVPGMGTEGCFQPSPGRPGYYLADLYSLARTRLKLSGVDAVFGGDYCTFSQAESFYSYRRDGQTGRMASLILIKAP
jgi:YfiH family protein